jgi:type IV pilus assembly protein PilO
MAITLESIIKLPTPHKIGLLVLISVFILGAYWQSIHRPKMQGIAAKESKLSELIRERNHKRNIAKNYEKFKEEVATLQEDLKQSLAKLPDRKEIPKLLKSISNMSTEAGLEVLLFKPKGEKPAQFYARVPVELKFVGSYHKIGMFFYYVSTLPRIVNIENFSIQNAQRKKSNELLLNTTCVATTYRYVESAPPPEKGKKR